MKILLTADWHIDAVTAGKPRLPEFDSYLESMIEAGPYDLVCFLGDAFDPGQRLGAVYTSTIIDAALRLDGSTTTRQIWIAGNHDVIETDRLATTLSPLDAMSVTMGDRLIVAQHPMFIDLVDRFGFGEESTSGHFGVLALPYVSGAYSRTDRYQEQLDFAFEHARHWRSMNRRLAVIHHLTVPGARMGSESREMARGRDHLTPENEIAELRPHLLASGHYHAAQVVKLAGTQNVIPGSPHRFTFGERADGQKGFTVIEL